MTFPGLLLSAAGVSVVMVGLVLSSESLRAGTAEQQTRATLRTVRAALLAYHARQGQMPPDPAPAAIAALLADPLAGPIIRTHGVTKDQSAAVSILDGYGRALRYVVHPGVEGVGRADFVSVGFDGTLGDPASGRARQRRCAIDDIYGSDTEASQGDQE